MDGTRVPLPMPNHARFKDATLRAICARAGVVRAPESLRTGLNRCGQEVVFPGRTVRMLHSLVSIVIVLLALLLADGRVRRC